MYIPFEWPQKVSYKLKKKKMLIAVLDVGKNSEMDIKQNYDKLKIEMWKKSKNNKE